MSTKKKLHNIVRHSGLSRIDSGCVRELTYQNDEAGLSILEVIISIAILTIIASSSVAAVLGSFSSVRLAKEETQATSLAVEAIEAVDSIRNQGWGNISAGTYGLDNSSGTWVLQGSSDTIGKFTRITTISTVQRSTSSEIVSTGGTLDPDSYQVATSVTWDFTPTRNNSVSMTSLITNWQQARGAGSSTPPGVTTCAEYCISQTYSAGTCRQNTGKCTQNSETYELAGDLYCTGGANADTCCCLP
jgi:type II secretory pathway pseudopilin PulG